MPITVGLLGHTGRVGSEILKNLIKYNQAGLIKPIVLHRPSSDISKIPSGIETRVLDLANDEPAQHLAAVEGINVVMSAIAAEAMYLQTPLLYALAQSKALDAFTLAEIGLPLNEDDKADPRLRFVAERFKEVERLGLTRKWTWVASGEFAHVVLGNEYYWLGVKAKENSLQLYKDALRYKTPLTTMEYLGAALGELVTKATSEYAGKTVEIYDHAPTGQDLADILTKVHGRTPAISAFTDDDLEAKISSDPFSALEAVSIKHWGQGYSESVEDIIKQSGGFRFEPTGWTGQSLESLVKSYM